MHRLTWGRLEFNILSTWWLRSHKYGHSELLQIILLILNCPHFSQRKDFILFWPGKRKRPNMARMATPTRNSKTIFDIILWCISIYWRMLKVLRCQQRRNQSLTSVTTRWNKQCPKHLRTDQVTWSAAEKLVQKTKTLAARKVAKSEDLKKWFSWNKGKGWVNCKTGGPFGRKSWKSGGSYSAWRPTVA